MGLSVETALAKGKTAVVVGAQWGDEGKGKIVDVLSHNFDVVARFAGGHNAGHTVHVSDKKFVLQLMPCGILRDDCLAVIGNGVVLDPISLLSEIARIREAGITVGDNLRISNRAHVILPYHRMVELGAENAPGQVKIGTTSRGIGPTYEDKMSRHGLRVADLLDSQLLRTHIEASCRQKNVLVKALYNSTEQLDPEKIYAEYSAAAEQIAPYVCDTARLLNDSIRAGKSVMFEGAQGAMLDIDHGTYPFVTSSSSTSGGAATGCGVGLTQIDTVVSVTKAYCTRVGEGPFPSEDHGATGDELRRLGNEFGAVTGRPRRCGWLDLPLLNYSNMINGTEWLVVTKMDILDQLAEIPVCVAYEIDGHVTDLVPPQDSGIRKIKPVYEKLPGWQSSTGAAKSYDELPTNAKKFLEFVASKTGCKIGMVSAGIDRDQIIYTDEFKSALIRG